MGLCEAGRCFCQSDAARFSIFNYAAAASSQTCAAFSAAICSGLAFAVKIKTSPQAIHCSNEQCASNVREN